MRVQASMMVLAFVAVSAWAFAPQPVQRSAAEKTLSEALASATKDSDKLRIAQEAFEANPEDIPLGRAAQDVILKQMENAVDYYKVRAEGSESIAAHYLYARASSDTSVMEREAKWILKKSPPQFWGLQLAAIAEWSKEKPNLRAVRMYLERSITADPSRPEGYLNLGYLCEEEERWNDARTAFEAGATCDPANASVRDARLTVYAHLRDGKAYFDLMKGAYPDAPLSPDLAFANRTGKLTQANLRGHFTVLEYWAYT